MEISGAKCRVTDDSSPESWFSLAAGGDPGTEAFRDLVSTHVSCSAESVHWSGIRAILDFCMFYIATHKLPFMHQIWIFVRRLMNMSASQLLSFCTITNFVCTSECVVQLFLCL